MNKTKIEWTDYTWNPVTGCEKGCWYCYGRKMYERFGKDFRPTLHEKRLEQPLKHKNPSKIFVCSIADLFGDWIPKDWIQRVINSTTWGDWHTYQFLTKNPERYASFDFPINCWFGATVTEQKDLWRIDTMRNVRGFISIEPLLEDISNLSFRKIKWIIIGALTGAESKKHQPKLEWLENILTQANKLKIPVFMKNNLKGIWGRELRQEFPNKLTEGIG